MRLSSSVFSDGAVIPRRYTCDGEDISPPLEWRNSPLATRSFVLLCYDPDAPIGTWHHWAAYDIPADVTSLPEDAANQSVKYGFKQANNDFDRPDYGGPCPPLRHGRHHYHFRLVALSIAHLPGKVATCRDVEREVRKHVLAEATLIGVYER